MARWLIPRPLSQAEDLALTLARAGHEAVVAPVLEVAFVETGRPDLAGVQALLFTSANGVRGFARIEPRRDLAAWAVGQATAEAARAAGFRRVASADGAAPDLARQVATRLDPAAGALLYAAGCTRAGALDAELAAAGFTVHRQEVYEARPAAALPAAAVAALREDGLDGVLLLSPRTARVFSGLTATAELTDRLGRLTAACLSPAVAAALEPGRWADIRVAPTPTLRSLLPLLGPSTRTPQHGQPE